MTRDQLRAVASAVALLTHHADVLRRSYGRRVGRQVWVVDDHAIRRELVEIDLAVHDLRTIEEPLCSHPHPTIQERRAGRCAFCEKPL